MFARRDRHVETLEVAAAGRAEVPGGIIQQDLRTIVGLQIKTRVKRVIRVVRDVRDHVRHDVVDIAKDVVEINSAVPRLIQEEGRRITGSLGVRANGTPRALGNGVVRDDGIARARYEVRLVNGHAVGQVIECHGLGRRIRTAALLVMRRQDPRGDRAIIGGQVSGVRVGHPACRFDGSVVPWRDSDGD